MEFIAEHWVLSVFITIILGAIGSGVWEALFRPIFSKAGSALFSLGTLGFKKAQDRVYREAARGHHELASLSVYFFITLGIFGGLIGTYSGIIIVTIWNNPAEAIQACEELPDKRKIMACRKQILKEEIFGQLPYFTLSTIFIFVLLMSRWIRINRANIIITEFDRWLKISAPYLDVTQIAVLQQRFALMENKEDCDQLMSELADIYRRNRSFSTP